MRTVRGEAADALQQSGTSEAVATRNAQKVRALTLNLAELEARMTRLDALGEHLTAMAGLQEGEFDFSEAPLFNCNYQAKN